MQETNSLQPATGITQQDIQNDFDTSHVKNGSGLEVFLILKFVLVLVVMGFSIYRIFRRPK